MSTQSSKNSKTKPVILVNTDYIEEKGETVQISANYPQSLKKAGAIPVLVSPYLNKSDILTLLEMADGVLLIGGRDYDPGLWGEPPHERTMLIPKLRQDFDILLTKCAMERGIPTFGICGGHQLINIVAGGSLFTHIEAQVTNALRHSPFPDFTKTIFHPVTIDPTSRLLSIIGDTTMTVNSYHHQSVRGLGRGLRVTATAPDGVIEGIEGVNALVFGVQWHPEKEIQDAVQQKLFKQFVAICMEDRGKRN